MHQERCGQQMQPERDIGATGRAGGIREVPAHRKSEYGNAGNEHERFQNGRRIVHPVENQDKQHAHHGSGACRHRDRYAESPPVQPRGQRSDEERGRRRALFIETPRRCRPAASR